MPKAVPSGRLSPVAGILMVLLLLGSTFAVIFGSTLAVSARSSGTITLTSPNPQYEGVFGLSVAASGGVVVVGAPGESVSENSSAGRAYTFNAGTGALMATLTSPHPQLNGAFGYSVAASGSVVVVGAPEEGAVGRAYTFNAETGALMANLTSPNRQNGLRFSWSVAISGNTVVVGAPEETVDGIHPAGGAYIFNAETGALMANLTSLNPEGGSCFGCSVAISGSVVVVGAPDENVSGIIAPGRAYTFNAGTGALMATLTSPHPQAHGEFGYVAASGGVVVVGEYGGTCGGYSLVGCAYTFNAGTGALTATLTSPNPQYEGSFGYSVAISSNTVVVGAIGAAGSVGYGDAYIFNTAATTSSSSSSSASLFSSSSSSATVPSGGGGIPEFPLQLGLVTLVMFVVVAAYVLTRRSASKRTPESGF